MFTPKGPILSPSYRHNFLSHNTFSYEGRRLHPIETGFVSFVPDRSKSPQAGKIENGRFQFNAYPGPNVVRILSEKKGAFNKGMNQYVYQQFLPAKYNDESELLEEVSADGENVFQFALTGE